MQMKETNKINKRPKFGRREKKNGAKCKSIRTDWLQIEREREQKNHTAKQFIWYTYAKG